VELKNQIKDQDKQLKDKENQLTELNSQIKAREKHVNQITGSFTWRIVSIFHRAINRMKSVFRHRARQIRAKRSA
jgi:septal ring factor EnvC (AmiA/AmiB activator)